MIFLLAGATLPDHVARDPRVAVVHPADLSQPGWSLPAGGPPALPATFPPADRLRGSLSTLVRVRAAHLPLVHPDDRAYVAAEMTAFLAAFLAALPGRTLNRADPADLTGPPFGPQRWLRAAAEAGLPVCNHEGAPAAREIVLVGDEVVAGDGRRVDPAAAAPLRRLGAHAGVGHLGARFCERHPTHLAAVTTRPELTATVWEAVARRLDAGDRP